MRHYSLKAIEELQNLHSFLYPDGNTFCPEKMTLELGMYKSIVIDVSNLPYNNTFVPTSTGSAEIVTEVYVSEDVKTLHEFMSFEQSIYVPCPECEKTLAFRPVQFKSHTNSKTNKSEESIEKQHMSAFQSAYPLYVFGKNTMDISFGNKSSIDFKKGKEQCVEGIIKNVREFKRCFECTLLPDHKLYLYFNIHKAIDVCKIPKEIKDYEERKKYDSSIQMTKDEKEIFDRYEKLRYILILEKVGQEPSMADLQMFDIEKYNSILSKERFRDFSMALGLYASGVGCGSLLYLRRIFESIVITAQIECEKLSGWDKDLYESKRFNEKIDYLENLGRKIIPDELSDVKTKIYGFLSKGVHELSEQEAMELFPHLKLAIELILDEQISQKERNEKIKAIKKALN